MVSQVVEGLDARLAQALTDGAFLSPERASAAQFKAAAGGQALAEVLIAEQLVSAETVSTLLSLILNVPVIDLQRAQAQPSALALIPRQIAQEWRVLPLAAEGGVLSLVMEDPTDGRKTSAISARTGLKVRPLLPLRWDLPQAAEAAYGRSAPAPAQPQIVPVLPPAPPLEQGLGQALRRSLWGDDTSFVPAAPPAEPTAPSNQKKAPGVLGALTAVNTGAAASGRVLAMTLTKAMGVLVWAVRSGVKGAASLAKRLRQARSKPTEAVKAGPVPAEGQSAAQAPGGELSPKGLALWMGAILLFGFGDTLTSLLVFVRGGSEANLLFQAILRVLGPSTLNFVLVKMAATVLALLAARLQPRVEGLVAWAMLLLGAFLVAQNSMALLAG